MTQFLESQLALTDIFIPWNQVIVLTTSDYTRDVKFGIQIGSLSQNVLKLILKSPRFFQFGANVDPIWMPNLKSLMDNLTFRELDLGGVPLQKDHLDFLCEPYWLETG